MDTHYLIKPRSSYQGDVGNAPLVVVRVEAEGNFEYSRTPELYRFTVSECREEIERLEVKEGGRTPEEAFYISHLTVDQYLAEADGEPQWMSDWWDKRNPS